MSFSCENCDSDLNGYVDVSCGGDNATTPSADYGVDIDPVSLLFSGYAWSDNIGWISFEPASVSGCDHFVGPGATSCQAFIESTTNDIHGWARACSVFQAGCSGTLKSNGERGGWDGWLKFDGSDVFYGSYVDNTPIPSEFRKWAWGDNVVIGWTSLNNLDTGGAADYKVITDLTLNAVPIASFSCEDCSSNPIASCKVYRGDTLCLVNNSTDPDGNDQIVLSEWHQDDLTDGLGYSLFSSCSPPPSPNLCSTTFGSTRGNWNVKLYVEDLMGGFDEDIKTVTVLRDIVASFECSLDNINWYACTDSGNISLVQGDTLYLRDTSVASEISFGSNAVVNNWTWTVDGSNAGSTSQINIPQVQTTGIVIELTVIDSGGRTDTRQEILLGAMPLPTWKEITPF